MGYAGGDGSLDDEGFEEEAEPSAFSPDARLAQAAPAEPAPPAPDTPVDPVQPPSTPVADATGASRPLIIYTASLTLAVFEVEQSIERVREIAEAHGGYVSRQMDLEIKVRVPVSQFEEVLSGLEGVGDVLSRRLESQDVSEEFQDLTLRIRTAEKLLQRLERLLERAENVEHALKVEREIRRLTQEIEGMKGRLKFLADRARFSTLTVRFRPVQERDIDQSDLFALPFPWLDQLGLDTLLEL